MVWNSLKIRPKSDEEEYNESQSLSHGGSKGGIMKRR